MLSTEELDRPKSLHPLARPVVLTTGCWPRGAQLRLNDPHRRLHRQIKVLPHQLHHIFLHATESHSKEDHKHTDQSNRA